MQRCYIVEIIYSKIVVWYYRICPERRGDNTTLYRDFQKKIVEILDFVQKPFLFFCIIPCSLRLNKRSPDIHGQYRSDLPTGFQLLNQLINKVK